MPDYFCNESLWLLRIVGAQLVFYAVDEQGLPLPKGLSKIAGANPGIVLLVHYFGREASCPELVDLCHTCNIWLIEDAAHVLMPYANIGKLGDVVLYSPHKHLAISDGALLVIRADGPCGLGEAVDALDLLEEITTQIRHEGVGAERRVSVWLVKRTLQSLGIRPNRNRAGLIQVPADNVPAMGAAEMSMISRRLLGLELGQLSGHLERRMRNAAQWESELRFPLFSEYARLGPSSVSPYMTEVQSIDAKAAAELFDAFIAARIPAVSWPDLPVEVTSNSASTIACEARRTRFFLPVHQSICSTQIRASAGRLWRTFTAAWSLREITSKAEWEALWQVCPRKSLPQTWEYGLAKQMAEGWRVRRLVVCDAEKTPVALFQVLTLIFPLIGGVARVNRGPLVIGNRSLDTGSHTALSAIAVLRRNMKRYQWRMLQIAPLLPRSTEVQTALCALGFKRRSNCPQDSALLSLGRDEEALLRGLNGKWRNGLRKGQKLGVKIVADHDGQRQFDKLIEFYHKQQQEKGFKGTSDKMLSALLNVQSETFRFNLFSAYDGIQGTEDELLGMLVTLKFGDVAEYLIGVTNEKGRVCQANSVMLWDAILSAKQMGCLWFDVGGLAENTSEGIANFKLGLNPEPYTVAGEWRRWL